MNEAEAAATVESVRAVRRNRFEPLAHVPALDGLRALAVALVLVFHAQVGVLEGGFLGVSVFFTLSGFLITALLLREWAGEQRIDGRRFWVRRLRRLTPAAWSGIALVLGFALAGVWQDEQLRDLRGDVPWSIVDLLNWHFIVQGTSYGDTFSAPSPLEHYWSLAVETQFYAVLLLVVIAVLTLGRTASRQVRLARLSVLLGVLLVASAAANLLLARTSIDRAYFGTDTRAAEMIAGALLACATLRRLRVQREALRRLIGPATVLALVGIVVLSSLATTQSRWLYPWGLLGTAACSSVVVLGLLQGGAAARVLELAPVVWLGRISYSVYVLHWPIFLWLTPTRTGLEPWPLLVLRLAVVLPVAVALFSFVERPIRERRWPTPRTAALLVPGVAAVLVLGTVAATRDLPPPPSFLAERDPDELVITEADDEADDGGDGAAADGDAVTTTTEAPGPRHPTRVLLVGDSVAASLETALAAEFEQRGISFASAASPGCGVVTGLPANAPDATIGLFDGVDISACSDTIPDRQLHAVQTFEPDLVVSLSTWEAVSRLVDGEWYEFATPAADELLVGLFGESASRLTGGGAAVAWVLPPDRVAGRNSLTAGPASSDLATSEHLRSLLRRVSAELPASTTADLHSIVCPSTPCPSEVDGVALRPGDGLHFDEPFAAALVARQLADQLAAIDLDALAPRG